MENATLEGLILDRYTDWLDSLMKAVAANRLVGRIVATV